MRYGEVAKRAFEITWKHRSLWVYGFLLALFSGGYSSGSNVYNTSDNQAVSKWQFEKLSSIPSETWIVIAIIAVALVVLFIALSIFFRNLANAALIGMVEDIEADGKTSVIKGFIHGVHSWFHLFIISIVVWLPFILIVVLLSGILIFPGVLALIAGHNSLGIVLLVFGILGAVILIFLAMLIGIVLSVLTVLSYRFRVIKEKGVFESISEGYQLLRANMAPVFLIWLILFGVGLAMGLLTLMATALMIPVVLMIMLFGMINIWAGLSGIFLVIPGILAIIFLNGLFKVFISSVWTLTYFELAS